MDDSKIAAAVLTTNDDPRSGLVARCKHNTTEVFIVWGAYLGTDPTQVTHRVDGGVIRAEKWGVSTDGTATFTRQPVDFLKTLIGKKELVVRVTPYDAGPKTLTFDLSGTNDALKGIRSLCNW